MKLFTYFSSYVHNHAEDIETANLCETKSNCLICKYSTFYNFSLQFSPRRVYYFDESFESLEITFGQAVASSYKSSLMTSFDDSQIAQAFQQSVLSVLPKLTCNHSCLIGQVAEFQQEFVQVISDFGNMYHSVLMVV